MDAGLHDAVLNAVRVVRSDVYGTDDRQLPVSEPEDALVPQIGFVGPDYRRGGTILLGINPGGGGNKYVRTKEDVLLLPMISSLHIGEGSPEALEAMFNQYAANMRTWNLWRIAEPVIAACGTSQSEIAYLNWCPFRTRDDKMPHAHAMRRSFDGYLCPLINELAPTRIIALGKKAGKWLEKMPLSGVDQYVVPRTNGDRYLSPNAVEAIEELNRSTRLPNTLPKKNCEPS